MEDKELLRNFKSIRQTLGKIVRMIDLIARAVYMNVEPEESEGEKGKDIRDIHPPKEIRRDLTYLG